MSGRLRDYFKAVLVSLKHPELHIDAEQYSAHFLRRGGASTAWLLGVLMEVLAVHGRWGSDAGSVVLYLVADTSHKLFVTQPM
jgi:hypothetical protein